MLVDLSTACRLQVLHFLFKKCLEWVKLYNNELIILQPPWLQKIDPPWGLGEGVGRLQVTQCTIDSGCCVLKSWNPLRDKHCFGTTYRQEHHKMTRKFWWMNGADTNQMQVFLVYSAEYRHFKELALDALSKLEEKQQQRIKQVNIYSLCQIALYLRKVKLSVWTKLRFSMQCNDVYTAGWRFESQWRESHSGSLGGVSCSHVTPSHITLYPLNRQYPL